MKINLLGQRRTDGRLFKTVALLAQVVVPDQHVPGTLPVHAVSSREDIPPETIGSSDSSSIVQLYKGIPSSTIF